LYKEEKTDIFIGFHRNLKLWMFLFEKKYTILNMNLIISNNYYSCYNIIIIIYNKIIDKYKKKNDLRLVFWLKLFLKYK